MEIPTRELTTSPTTAILRGRDMAKRLGAVEATEDAVAEAVVEKGEAKKRRRGEAAE